MFDDRPRIAHTHNKTIIIDPDAPDPVVETGSFNFSYSAGASKCRERSARPHLWRQPMNDISSSDWLPPIRSNRRRPP